MQCSRDSLESRIVWGFRDACIFAWPENESTEEAFWSVSAGEKLSDFVHAFVNDNEKLILSMLDDNNSEYATAEQIGQDLYFNCDGHGVGFWEQEESKPLDIWCEEYLHTGSVDAYLGDDGKIYIGGLIKHK